MNYTPRARRNIDEKDSNIVENVIEEHNFIFIINYADIYCKIMRQVEIIQIKDKL